ncbi:hypothetical protein BGX33_006338, partial [Mortierella sp. NVP41]
MHLILLFICRTTTGILFLGKEPTDMQRHHFGKHFEKLHEVMVETIQPNKDDEQAMTDEEDGAVAFCQAARNILRLADMDSSLAEDGQAEDDQTMDVVEDSPEVEGGDGFENVIDGGAGYDEAASSGDGITGVDSNVKDVCEVS